MISAHLAASAAIILALTGPAAAVAVNRVTPCCDRFGWLAYRTAQTRPISASALKLRLGSYGAYWAGGQVERVAPED